MEIQGLDYNTQRSQLRLGAYGREIQQMVDHCVTLPTKEQRLLCAKTIIEAMNKVNPAQGTKAERAQTLWNHLAIMSEFKLDIDYPVEVTSAEKYSAAPSKVPYGNERIPVRHYGKHLFSVFEILKTMPEGPERDQLVEKTANQMKRCLIMWGHGSIENEKVVDDLARFTDGVIQIDVNTFKFEKIKAKDLVQKETKKKKKK